MDVYVAASGSAATGLYLTHMIQDPELDDRRNLMSCCGRGACNGQCDSFTHVLGASSTCKNSVTIEDDDVYDICDAPQHDGATP